MTKDNVSHVDEIRLTFLLSYYLYNNNLDRNSEFVVNFKFRL